MTASVPPLDVGPMQQGGPPAGDRGALARYGAALLVATVAVLLTEALRPVVPQLTWLLVLGGVSVASWFGGLGPGLVATALGGAGILLLRVEPTASLAITRPADAYWLLSFVAVAVGTSVVTNNLHRERRAAERTASQFRALADQYRALAHDLESHAARLEREMTGHGATAAALRASEERFRLLVAGVQEYAIFALDPAGVVTNWNVGAHRITGVPAEAAVGGQLAALYPEEDRLAGAPERELRRAAEEGHHEAARWLVRRDGTRVWATLAITAMRRDDGTLVGYSVVTRDLSELRRHELAAQASEARLAGIIGTAMDAIITTDAERRIVLFNAAAERVFGVAADEVLGSAIERFVPARLREAHVAHVQRFAESAAPDAMVGAHRPGSTLPALRADGSEFPAEATIARLDIGGERYFTVVLRDVSERLRIEASERETREEAEATARRLREQAVALEHQTAQAEALASEVRRANDELREAVAIARAASQAKSDFLATMSHEIRTPINAILGFNELLEIGVAGPLTEEQRAYAERVRASGRHLLGIVNELLDLAKVEAGRLAVRRRSGRLQPPVEAAVLLIRPQAAAREIEIGSACDAALPYEGDEDRVRQILVNLLSNAVKFSPAGGRVRVVCEAVAPGDPALPDGLAQVGAVAVRVTDAGIGIPAGKLDAVFEPFVQLDTGYTRARGGTGLGLTISRQLARLMGGDLTVASEEARGSTFTLWLAPLRAAEPSAEAAVPAPPEDDGTGAIGELLTAGPVTAIVTTVTDRLRADPTTAVARRLDDASLEDHLGTLVRDLGRLLVFADLPASPAAGDAVRPLDALLADASAIQRTIAERHGAQRARLGWGEAALLREFEIVRQELERAVQQAPPPATPAAVARSLALLRPLLERAAVISLHALRAARETRARPDATSD